MSTDRIAALVKALELSPESDPLRLLLAELLQKDGREKEPLGAEKVDLAARCIEEALTADRELPLTMKQFGRAPADLSPTTLDWLGRARDYVEFASHREQYREVADFLRSREIRHWK